MLYMRKTTIVTSLAQAPGQEYYCGVEVKFHIFVLSIPLCYLKFSICILSNTTRQILIRTYYIGDMFRLIL
jgi:hypothetical protein